MPDFNQSPLNQMSLALAGPGLGLGSDTAAATLRSDTTAFVVDGTSLGASISASSGSGSGSGSSGSGSGGEPEPTTGQIWPRWRPSS